MTDTRWYVATSHGYQVGLLLGSEAAASVAERGRPWMRMDHVRGPLSPGVPRVIAGVTGDIAPAGTVFREQENNGQLREVLVDRATKSVWVPAQPSKPWYVLQLLRTVRNLLRWQALEDGHPCLHAGLIEIDGAGIIVAGHKRSGKTSTILTALSLLHCHFVSNDDVTLMPRQREPGAKWMGVGWPRSVNVRTDALAVLAQFIPALGKLHKYSTHPRMDYVRPGSPSFTLYPDDICGVLDVRLISSAPVAAIVLPRFADEGEPSLAPLAADRAAAMLSENIDKIATSRDCYLRDWFKEVDETAAHDHASRLASDISCYELVQNLHSAATSAALLADLAHTIRSEA